MALLKETFKIRLLGFLKIPMLWFASPSIEEINDEKCVVKIPLTRRTKNHLNSMYFGALCVGADAAGGVIAWELIQKSTAKIQLVFKSFKADFLARPLGDVYFTCTQGREIAELVRKAESSSERQNMDLHMTAETRLKGEPLQVAKFVLELSLKKK